jgi:hypothetical protein
MFENLDLAAIRDRNAPRRAKAQEDREQTISRIQIDAETLNIVEVPRDQWEPDADQDIDTLLAEVERLQAERDGLKVLAEKNYGNLEPSGLCSKSHGGVRTYTCGPCYPNWKRLAENHNELKQEAWAKIAAALKLCQEGNMQAVVDKLSEPISWLHTSPTQQSNPVPVSDIPTT